MNKINDLVALSKNKYLSLYDAVYTNKNKEERTWTVATRKSEDEVRGIYFENKEDKPDAVVLIAIHEESKQLVLVKQYRVPINAYIYELPAGLIDQGDGIEETVKRELREETGLELVEIYHEKSKEKVYLSAGMTDESVALIYCTCRGTVSNQYLEADEDIEPLLVSKEEAEEILLSNDKIDVKAFMALQEFVKDREGILKK